MKKILLILLTLFSISGYSQTPYGVPYTTIGAAQNSAGKIKGGLFVDSTFSPPVYSDTNAANTSRTSLYAGSIIRVGNAYYYRSNDALRWILFGSSGGSVCPGTQLITGSATWSTVLLIYDVTDATYYIGCNYYASNATTITLSGADPTYPRIDIIIVDTFGLVSVITGTPAANPIKPQANPLSQLELTHVDIAAGATIPTGTTATVIYDENIEWGGASDVSGIDFAYTTNPYTGTKSTLVPSPTNSEYVTWTSGSVLDILDYDYLKFYIRINTASISDGQQLAVSFYSSVSQISQEFVLTSGVYGFDGTLTGSYQLIVIPLEGMVITTNSFDKLYVRILGEPPTNFQLDRVYLLSGSNEPPVMSDDWTLSGNDVSSGLPRKFGTTSNNSLDIYTNDSLRLSIPEYGIIENTTDTLKYLVFNPTTKDIEYKVPDSVAFTAPKLRVVVAGNIRTVFADTWGLTGDAGTVAGTNFLGTTDNVDLVFKRNSIEAGRIGSTATSFGLNSLLNNTAIHNTAFGASSLTSVTSGVGNTAFGYSSLSLNVTGTNNTAFGRFALQSNTGNDNTALGGNAMSSSSVSGSRNVAVGRLAMQSHTTGSDNIAIGYQSLNLVGAGSFNIAIGSGALDENTASSNVAVGQGTFTNVTTGTRNVGLGSFVGGGLVSGSFNTAVGDSATFSSATVDSSISLGYKASAATREFAISPYITQIKATGLTTSSGRVLTDVAGNGILTLEPPSGGATPGIDDVLGVGQALTTLRVMDISGAGFEIKDVAGTSLGLEIDGTGSVTATGDLAVNGTTTLNGITNLTGIIHLNGASGSAGDVLTSAGAGVDNVWAPIPTLNQNTTGSAATLTTSRNIFGQPFNGSADVAGTGTFIPSANLSAIVSSGYSVTGSGVTPLLDLSGTWNTSGAATGIKLNITNTASGFANLMDLQTGGASMFTVSKAGAAAAVTGIFTTLGTNSTLANSNFEAFSITAGSVTASALAGSTNTNWRSRFGGSANSTITANNSMASVFMNTVSITEAASGTHPLFAQLAIKPLTITAGAGALTNSASLYIENAASGATNNYPLWIDDGTTRLDGGVLGTITNDAATAGNIGEEINAIQSTYTNYATTATYQNITSITLTAGDWDLSAFMTYSSNAATITAASNAIFVISTTTASAAGATEGRNISYVPQAALLGTSLFSESITPYRVSISGTTTYYLNTQATFTLGNPQYVGGLRARRVR